MPRLARLQRHLSEINPVAIAIELAIVFLGVYLAFVFSQSQETRRLEAKRQTVIELLANQVTRYQQLFAGFTLYHDGLNEEVLLELRSGQVPDFGDVIYVAPQYPSDAIDYVLTNQSLDVFDLELYVPLASFAHRIQQLMTVEAELTALGNRYVSADRGDPLYAEQFQLGVRYHRFMESRRTITADLAEKAGELIGLLGPPGAGDDSEN